jgi:hypothetical protein
LRLPHCPAPEGDVMHSHIFRRRGVWWARFVVPMRLRHSAGRREFSQSTRTHELHIAKVVSACAIACAWFSSSAIRRGYRQRRFIEAVAAACSR